MAYYFKHVVSEIQQFYPEEYEMFELLASGQISDFIELSVIVEYTKHLYSYGLVDKDENGIPFVKMPVAGCYVAMELAKKENRKSIYKVIEKERRNDWVTQRQKSLLEIYVSLNLLSAEQIAISYLVKTRFLRQKNLLRLHLLVRKSSLKYSLIFVTDALLSQ